MKSLRNNLGIGLASLTFGLVGCGDSGTTEIVNNNYTSGMEIVDKVSDLPKCTSENAGDQALVKADGEAYYCSGKEWKVLGGASGIDTVIVSNTDTLFVSNSDTVYVSGGDFNCTTENLADSSGVNIVCNGEVIGTVLNGKDGAQGIQGEKGDTGATGSAGADGKDGVNGTDGKDGTDGVGCSVASSTETTVTIKCGNDTFNMNLNGSSEGGDVAKVDTTYVPELSGVSQKGPFVTGTEVKGYELDGTRSFAQTGRSFTGKINSDDGKFSINSVKLVSTQVLLSATGYYRNEVTGKNSTAPISLYAVTDLSDRKNVNVNLLTHLEYDRVAYKMKNSDGTLKIKAAKKAAQQEILKTVFGIENADFKSSEDLDIFGSSEGDAALLALSILLQGPRSESELTELLTSFGQDIEKDGKWDDLETRGNIARWALVREGSYGKFRNYVKGWNPDAEVPAFEKYLRTFWSREYGLGVCGSDSVPVGTVKNATNNNGDAKYDYAESYTSQDNKKRFICVDADSLKWREASDIEKDTAGWGYGSKTTHKVGDIRNGQVNTNLVYVFDDVDGVLSWRRGSGIETLMKNSGYYACTKSHVGDTSSIRITYGGDRVESDYGIYQSNVVDNSYVVCSVSDDEDLYRWTAVDTLYNDTYEARDKCTDKMDGSLMKGLVNTNITYVCDYADMDKDGVSGWQKASSGDIAVGHGCRPTSKDTLVVGNYVCDSGKWNKIAGMGYMLTWNGSDSHRVETGLYDYTGTSGYWFVKENSHDKSFASWTVELDEGLDSLGPVIDYYKGLHLTANFDSTADYSLVEVAFKLVGDTSLIYDATAWEGVCVTYVSDCNDLRLQLVPPTETTSDVPYVSLTKTNSSSSPNNFYWDRFKQGGWGTKVDIKADVITNLKQISFNLFRSQNQKTCDVTIYEIGMYGQCSGKWY